VRHLPNAILALFVGLVPFLNPSPALAAEQSDTTRVVPLPPVIVTGTVQRVPQAISVWSGDGLARTGVTSALDLQRSVPNLSQHHAGLRSFSDNYVVRGIGNTEFFSDPAVALYVDDAPFGGNVSYSTDLLAVDHVEFWRGPQGSRFGKNAAAGVMNIFTRQPRDRFESGGSASGASRDTWLYRGSAAGPLVKDKLCFSLAGEHERSDGYIRNSYLGTRADELEGSNGRGALEWTPAESWNVRFTGTVERYRDGIGIVSLNGKPRETMSELAGRLETKANSQSLRVTRTLPGLALMSITTRRDFQIDPFEFDPDFSPLPGNKAVIKYQQGQWTQELRVRPIPAEHARRWDWHAGVFLSTGEIDINRAVDIFVPPSLTGRDVTDFTLGSDTYALFGEYTRALARRTEMTLGLRLDYTDRDLHRTHTSTFGSPPRVDANEGFFNTAPKLTLSYHVGSSVLAYGSTGLGFKPGGFTGLVDPPGSPRFDTERTWANEIGVKSTRPDDKLVTNLALFYYDLTDYQVEQPSANGFDISVANAPKARSFGVELEVTARPARGWEWAGQFGYTNARLERFDDPVSGSQVRDTHPPYVPDFNGSAAAQYQHRTGLLGRVEVAGAGDAFYDATNTSRFKQSAYALLNGRVGYERGRTGYYFYGENLTDTEYFSKKISAINAGAPGRPRTFGLTLSTRY
jgi:iron complex outermembrane recepter protein